MGAKMRDVDGPRSQAVMISTSGAPMDKPAQATGGGGLRLSRVLYLGVRQKIVLILLFTLLVTLSAGGLLALRDHRQDVVAEARRHGTELVQLVAQTLAFSVVGYDYHAIELLLGKLADREDVVYARVTSARGNAMAEVGRLGDPDGQHLRFEKDIRVGSELVGRLTVVMSTDRITKTLAARRETLIWRDLGTILVIALIEFLALSWFIVRPITRISRALGTRGGEAPIPVVSGDEIGIMASEFNRLRANLIEANAKLADKVALADENLSRINEELRRLTLTDPLTGLNNRRFFEKLIEDEAAVLARHPERGPNSVILMDIDGFKQLNDRYGHDVGDEVIREIARILQHRVRRTDALCRIGGDEFFLLCRGADREQAMSIAEELRDSVASRPLAVSNRSIAATLSLGAATLAGDPATEGMDTLFRRADQALYESKRRGRNRATHALDVESEQPA